MRMCVYIQIHTDLSYEIQCGKRVPKVYVPLTQPCPKFSRNHLGDEHLRMLPSHTVYVCVCVCVCVIFKE